MRLSRAAGLGAVQRPATARIPCGKEFARLTRSRALCSMGFQKGRPGSGRGPEPSDLAVCSRRRILAASADSSDPRIDSGPTLCFGHTALTERRSQGAEGEAGMLHCRDPRHWRERAQSRSVWLFCTNRARPDAALPRGAPAAHLNVGAVNLAPQELYFRSVNHPETGSGASECSVPKGSPYRRQ